MGRLVIGGGGGTAWHRQRGSRVGVSEGELVEMCRYVSFETLRKRVKEVGNVAKYLRPEFLDDVAESCELEEEG